MKNFKTLSVLILLAWFTAFEAAAGTWIFFSYGHPIGLYGSVDVDYLFSNNHDDFYSVDCSGLGLKRCRFSQAAPGPNGGGIDPAVAQTVEDIQTNVELEIVNASASASDQGSATVIRVNADNSHTTFVVKWKYDFNMETEVTELEINIEEYEELL